MPQDGLSVSYVTTSANKSALYVYNMTNNSTTKIAEADKISFPYAWALDNRRFAFGMGPNIEEMDLFLASTLDNSYQKIFAVGQSVMVYAVGLLP